MSELDVVLNQRAAGQHNLVTRTNVRRAGGSDHHIATRVRTGQWQVLHPAVYLAKPGPATWEERLHGAVLSTEGTSAASHESAIVLWDLDGVTGHPLRITVSMEEAPVGRGIRITRTRRPIEPVSCRGIPTMSVERTLLDVAGTLPRTTVRKAAESAFRRGLVTPAALLDAVDRLGGRGVKGTVWLREYLIGRGEGRAAGSAAEAELLAVLESWGIEPPVRQLEIPLPNGEVAVVDAGWPVRRKLLEVDGFAFHSSPEALAADHRRQNLIAEAGYELRRYAAVDIRRDPEAVARSVIRFLYAPRPLHRRPA